MVMDKFRRARAAFVVGVLALAGVSVAGCSKVDLAQVSSIIDQVSAVTKNTCAFLPTATTVANIVAKNDPNISTATQIATAVCNSVQTAKRARMGVPNSDGLSTVVPLPNPVLAYTAPAVAGVPVEGVLLH